MAPGARNKLGAPYSNLRPFGSKCAVEKSTCDIGETFRRPPQWFGVPTAIRRQGNCAPFAPLVMPLPVFNRFLNKNSSIWREWFAKSSNMSCCKAVCFSICNCCFQFVKRKNLFMRVSRIRVWRADFRSEEAKFGRLSEGCRKMHRRAYALKLISQRISFVLIVTCNDSIIFKLWCASEGQGSRTVDSLLTVYWFQPQGPQDMASSHIKQNKTLA